MENRNFKRTDCKLDAVLYFDGKKHKGTIENMSEDGLLNMVVLEDNVTSLAPGMITEIKFQTPSGEKIDLICFIAWAIKDPDQTAENKYDIGLEVLLRRPKYTAFVKSL